MRTIAIINQKGGCGKTTTSINLAACLARLNQKTLLVDMDPQGHCGVGLAVPEDQIERTIYDCLIEEGDGRVFRVNEIVWQIATDFDLAPSNLKLSAFEQVFAGRPGREDRLHKALMPAREHYKWTIIDCPPSVGLITFNALQACDTVIVPVETGFFSLHGLAKMLETLELMRERCDHPIRIRILPTLYDTRTKLAREVLSELRSKFGSMLMDSTVNFNTKLKEAASFGQPITEYDPGSKGYKDFLKLARELMGHAAADQPAMAMAGVGTGLPGDALLDSDMSRPAELVQRAKQLAQLTNVQFGRTLVTINEPAKAATAAEETRETVTERFEPAASAEKQDVIPVSIAKRIGLTEEQGTESSAGELQQHMADVSVQQNDAAADAATVPSSEENIQGPYPIQSGHPLPLNSQHLTTQQKIDEFYGVRQLGDEVVIATDLETASSVRIAGDFNHWNDQATPMLRRGKAWVIKLPLNPGRYRYRLVVDGRWVTDPSNTYVETNEYGELNNILDVA